MACASDTPEQFTEHSHNEVAKWGKVVKATGARVASCYWF